MTSDRALALFGQLLLYAPGIAALIVALIQWRKNRTDGAQTITDTALKLIEPLRLRIAEQEAHSLEQDKEIVGLKVELASALKREGEYLIGISLLINQIVGLAHDPVWRPSGRKPEAGKLP